MFIATLIAADRLRSGDISAAEDRLRAAGIEPAGRSWVEPDSACDLLFGAAPDRARIALETDGIDLVVQGEAGRRKRLLVADMDSTIITVECIDELAGYAGVKDRVAGITERAMRGELDFEGALTERVALLEGLTADVIDRCHEERVLLTPGARELVGTMRRDGAHCLLVSGGFTVFADRVAADAGFHRAAANQLELADNRLTGRVIGPVLGAEAKRRALIDAAAALNLDLSDTLAVGDGANDIPMLDAAGLGVAYRAKPAVAAVAAARIEHGDLTALLFAQGYARSEWATASG
jgi:phosphoserine phosphatase